MEPYTLSRKNWAYWFPVSAHSVRSSNVRSISLGTVSVPLSRSFPSWYLQNGLPPCAAFSNQGSAAASSRSVPTPWKSIQPMRYWSRSSGDLSAMTWNPRNT